MKIKAVILTVIVALAAVGIFAIAADYGTQNDPLVTLSYITDVFAPDLLNKAQQVSDSTAKQVNSNVTSYEARVDKKVNEFLDRNTAKVTESMIDQIAGKVQIPTTKQSAPFTTLSLTSGKTVVITAGCEILFRSGSASVTKGALIDVTNGALVSPGGSVSANHLYTTTESTTVSVKSNSTVLVKGQYSAY